MTPAKASPEAGEELSYQADKGTPPCQHTAYKHHSSLTHLSQSTTSVTHAPLTKHNFRHSRTSHKAQLPSLTHLSQSTTSVTRAPLTKHNFRHSRSSHKAQLPTLMHLSLKTTSLPTHRLQASLVSHAPAHAEVLCVGGGGGGEGVGVCGFGGVRVWGWGVGGCFKFHTDLIRIFMVQFASPCDCLKSDS